MEPRISLVMLGVADLQRAPRFYEEMLKLPRITTPPEVTFFELGKTWLALYPRESLAAVTGLGATPFSCLSFNQLALWKLTDRLILHRHAGL